MKVFLTGGTGFIGSAVARLLRERGDELVALVRSPAKAEVLTALGCDVVPGGLRDGNTLRRAMEGCDVVVHGAAIYEVGVSRERCAEMYETNVVGTEAVVRAATDAGVDRVIYISTVNAFGNTRGAIVDESHVHHEEYVSCYDETKHLAHKAVVRAIADGVPAIIVQPSLVYGPGDTSVTGELMTRFLDGKLPAMVFPDTGVSFVYIDDVAAGILLALDKGRVGESYVLGGEIATMGEMISSLAEGAGRRPPRVTVPVWSLRLVAPAGPLLGPLLGFPKNLREVIRASAGVTYWARHDKATKELGYRARSLREGLAAKLAAEGRV